MFYNLDLIVWQSRSGVETDRQLELLGLAECRIDAILIVSFLYTTT